MERVGSQGPQVRSRSLFIALWLASVTVAGAGELAFTDVTEEARVKSDVRITRGNYGAAFVDFDGDGRLDIHTANRLGDFLYHNNGDGTFTDVAVLAGVVNLSQRRQTGCGIFADVDNDGDLDLFTTAMQTSNALYLNDGTGRFEDAADQLGLADGENNFYTSAAFADIDLDADLDLYVVQVGHDSLNVLYRNDGAAGFADITELWGGVANGGWSLQPLFADYDNDGDPDLYVINDYGPDVFYRNEHPEPRFTDVTAESGLVERGLGMGGMWADYDQDGDLDLYITNHGDNALARNRGDGTFEWVTDAGVYDYLTGWGTGFFDVENDGDLDLYVVNGYIGKGLNPHQPDVFYVNPGNGHFEDATAAIGLDTRKANGRGSALGDYDRDGDLDLYVVNIDAPNVLYRNDSVGGHWLNVATVGTLSNRDGVGTRVTVETDGRRWMQEVAIGSSFASQDSPELEFGFGTATRIERIHVRWPSGIEQELRDVEVDQRLTLIEPTPTAVLERNDTEGTAPTAFRLGLPTPNPFNAETGVVFDLPRGTDIRLVVFDPLGRVVRTLVNDAIAPGRYLITWDGRDDAGRAAASGLFFVHLQADDFSATRKLALVR